MPYRLIPSMLQNLRESLGTYHKLFSGDRCQAWKLEELTTKAINSDTQTQHHARWNEGGDDDNEDINVRTNEQTIGIQIKSGQVRPRKKILALSGHRFTRFKDDLHSISEYLNTRRIDITSVSYKKIDNQSGRQHEYTVRYIEIEKLTSVLPEKWEKHGSHFRQKNHCGVLFKIVPNMSWQVWWEIPLTQTEEANHFII